MFRLFFMAAVALPLVAQDNWCSESSSWTSNLKTHAEVREEKLPAASEIEVNPDQNGSIRVHGWANSDIRVKACLRAAAESDAEAAALAKQVTITDGPGRVVAKGPHPGNHSWWSVSYEVWLPNRADVKIFTENGSIAADGLESHIQAHATNGSLRFSDVAGNLDGSTTNGSINVDVGINGLRGGSLALNATNGSIKLNLVPDISVQVEASTVNGSVHSDFASNETTDGARHDRHHMSFTLGSGGGKITATTTNGSVRISRQS